jgi:hypothetical protein
VNALVGLMVITKALTIARAFAMPALCWLKPVGGDLQRDRQVRCARETCPKVQLRSGSTT